jgi:hypothetical protein
MSVNVKSTVSTPTPLLDYTLRHKHELELRKEIFNKHYDRVDEYYDWKRIKYTEQKRLEEERELRKNLEEMHQYENLKNRTDYNNYRYQFYIGTLVDFYI